MDEKPDLSKIEPLGKQHKLDEFDSGKEPLNIWLKKLAFVNQASDASRTYVLHRNNSVVGYYAISAGSIRRQEATSRVAKGGQPDPVPVSLLARLAVDKREQGNGLGKALLKDALLRMEHAADIIGIRAVLVHAIDQDARAFYKKFDFEECPVDELHLMLLMKDLRAILRQK